MDPLPIKTASFDIAALPGSLPVANISPDVEVAAVAAAGISKLSSLDVADLVSDVLWRDSLVLTGTFRTFFSPAVVVEAWRETNSFCQSTDFALVPGSARTIRHGPQTSWVEAQFSFRAMNKQLHTTGSGFVSLVPGDESGTWRIWMLRTILEQLVGQGDVDDLRPRDEVHDKVTAVNGDNNNRSSDKTDFECIVVGGGQAGLATAGRLQALGVSYLLVDRHPHVGDSWNTRYDSVKLHTIREYSHLPFERTFGPDYPESLTKQDLATGYQRWVRKYGINIQCSTEMVSASWQEGKKIWTCKLVRDGNEGITMTSRHLVFALGAGSQRPYMPEYPNRAAFEGTIIHSADYKRATQWKDKAGVVIGTGNSAHDVADDMLEAGLSSVTMVQRSRTWVLPQENYRRALAPIYSPHIPTEMADRASFSNPVVIFRKIAMMHLHDMARGQAERFEALESVGFRVEPFGDLADVLYVKMGGHYMDVGTSGKIARGMIKVKSAAGAGIVGYTPKGLAFGDGTELEADVVVFTTGFVGNMRRLVGAIVGEEVEARIEDFWGLDGEGELYGSAKPSGHPGLWYIGADTGFSRYHSRFVALQVRADLMGVPFRIYDRTPGRGEKGDGEVG